MRDKIVDDIPGTILLSVRRSGDRVASRIVPDHGANTTSVIDSVAIAVVVGRPPGTREFRTACVGGSDGDFVYSAQDGVDFRSVETAEGRSVAVDASLATRCEVVNVM